MQLQSNDPNIQTFWHVCGLDKDDESILWSVRGYIVPLIPGLTDAFYETLATDGQTAPLIEGRVEQLKRTHAAWLESLFNGDYGADFIRRQQQIGEVHVRAKIPPTFVAASMSFLRGALPDVLAANIADKDDAKAAMSTLLRLFDLCQFLIDRSYDGTLSDGLMGNLGISPALLARLQTVGKKP